MSVDSQVSTVDNEITGKGSLEQQFAMIWVALFGFH